MTTVIRKFLCSSNFCVFENFWQKFNAQIFLCSIDRLHTNSKKKIFLQSFIRNKNAKITFAKIFCFAVYILIEIFSDHTFCDRELPQTNSS